MRGSGADAEAFFLPTFHFISRALYFGDRYDFCLYAVRATTFFSRHSRAMQGVGDQSQIERNRGRKVAPASGEEIVPAFCALGFVFPRSGQTGAPVRKKRCPSFICLLYLLVAIRG